VGPRAGLDGRKVSSPPGFDPGPSSPLSVAIPTELPGLHLTRIKGTLHEYIYIFVTVSHSFLLIVFLIKVVEKMKTHILCLLTPPPAPNRSVYEIIWKNVLESGRPQMMTWHMRIACWITKAVDTLSECLLFIHGSNCDASTPLCPLPPGAIYCQPATPTPIQCNSYI